MCGRAILASCTLGVRARTQPRRGFDERRAAADVEERDRLAGTKDGVRPASAPPAAGARVARARRSIRSMATDAIAASAHRTSTRGHGRSPRRHESPFVDPDEPRRRACRSVALPRGLNVSERRVADAQRIVAGLERRRTRDIGDRLVDAQRDVSRLIVEPLHAASTADRCRDRYRAAGHRCRCRRRTGEAAVRSPITSRRTATGSSRA